MFSQAKICNATVGRNCRADHCRQGYMFSMFFCTGVSGDGASEDERGTGKTCHPGRGEDHDGADY